MKWLLILLMPLALAGCSVGHLALPMTLGPSDTPKASCLTYADAPAFGDCKRPGEVYYRDQTLGYLTYDTKLPAIFVLKLMFIDDQKQLFLFVGATFRLEAAR